MRLYQDIISTQLLIRNGNFSSGKKKKGVKAKFFFIEDWVENREIKVIDCSAEEMQAYILIKPLQGMAFQTMRAILLKCLISKRKGRVNQQRGVHASLLLPSDW
jgi:hypothetical protein